MHEVILFIVGVFIGLIFPKLVKFAQKDVTSQITYSHPLEKTYFVEPLNVIESYKQSNSIDEFISKIK